ncbi:MAG: hypothetical protein ABIY55_27255 [Kofleriaceae bacterium]
MDLDAAIAFAPALADLDPRLHDEVLDWCIQFAGDFASVSCIKHCLKLFDLDHQERFERFAAIVNAHGGTKWPTSLPPQPFTPRGKSRCRLDKPASVQLRARKIFGINARADILVGLALYPTDPKPRWTHVNLLLDLGYTKRSLSEALNDLSAGGMLGTLKFGNTIRYALRNHGPLRQLLDPLPDTLGAGWSYLLPLAASLLSAQRRTHGKSVTTQAVEARKALESRRVTLERSLIPLPDLSVGDPWPQIAVWMGPLLRP